MKLQVEQWSACVEELLPLFTKLWADVAIDKDKFVACCDQTKYKALEDLGILCLVTARVSGTLVGFFLMFVTPNAHYFGAGPMGFTDMYYLEPEYRKGNNGLKLFSFMEEVMRSMGVVKMYSSHKLHRDRSIMMRTLGWKTSDIVYSKVLA